MKTSELKIIAVILAVALVFTVIASNAVSVASIVFLAKNDIAGAPAEQQQAQPQQQQQGTVTTPNGNQSTTPDATQPSGNNGAATTPDANKPADNGATADAWDTAKTFNFYKDAAHNMATKGNAGYDKIEWQVL